MRYPKKGSVKHFLEKISDSYKIKGDRFVMSISKHLQTLLNSVSVDSRTAEESLNQRAVTNMNNYIKLMNYRLQLHEPDAENDTNKNIDQLLSFIHRHVEENSYRGRDMNEYCYEPSSEDIS